MRIKTIAVSALGFMASLFVACDEEGPVVESVTSDEMTATALGTTCTSEPTIASWSPGHLDVLYSATDGALHRRIFDRGWLPGDEGDGGKLLSAPSAVSWGKNRIDVFARGTVPIDICPPDRPCRTLESAPQLIHNWYDGAWRGWEGLGGDITSAPSAISWSEGRLDIFYAGGDATLKHKWFQGAWHPEEPWGTVPIVGAPGAVTWGVGRIDVFARSSSNALFHDWYEDGARGNELLGGVLASPPAAASRGFGKLDIFYRGTDNALKRRAYDAGFLAEESLGGTLVSGPSAVSWGGNRIDIASCQTVKTGAKRSHQIVHQTMIDTVNHDVLTQHNNNARTGANLDERTLTTSNVNPSQFGKLFHWDVQGHVYAQPLYVQGATARGRNVVYIATEHNMLYAFDADATSATAPIWSRSLGTPIDERPKAGGRGNIYPEMGITSTPVIDIATRTMYVVAAVSAGVVNDGVFQIHALDLETGDERPGSPKDIAVPAGVAAPFGFHSAEPYLQRAALLMTKTDIVMAFGSLWGDRIDVHGDVHGWLIAYSKDTLSLAGAFVSTKEEILGGMWGGGAGPAANARDEIFVFTGNALNGAPSSYGDCMLALSRRASGLVLDSFFAPYQPDDRIGGDADLGSGAPLLLPGTNNFIGVGKAGVLFVMNQSSLGGRSVDFASEGRAVLQRFDVGGDRKQVLGAPAYWEGPTGSHLYVWPSGERLRSFDVAGGLLGPTPKFGQGGRAIHPDHNPKVSISANRNKAGSGILWANVINLGGIPTDATNTLVAYDASSDGMPVVRELWSTDAFAEDAVVGRARMGMQTVAGGRLFFGTYDWIEGYTSPEPPAGHVVVYGLLPAPRAWTPPPPPDAGPSCGDPGAAQPTTWTHVYNTYFKGSTVGDGSLSGQSVGHCNACHTAGWGGFRTSSDNDKHAFYEALRTQDVRIGLSTATHKLVVPGAGAAASPLGDPAVTPLGWIQSQVQPKPMPQDSPSCNARAEAAIRGWLGAGAPECATNADCDGGRTCSASRCL